MDTLFTYSAPVRRSVVVLRLPMGTGNDGADSPSLAKALDLLLSPSHVEFAPAVQLIPAQDGSSSWRQTSIYAYNILSVGLDAYVTHMTNIMKGKVPGDAYRFWVDMATLSYEKKYKVGNIEVKAFDDKDKKVASFNEKLLLLAMGVTGHRTYGSQQHILPDDRNVCGIKKVSFLGKLALKGKVARGKHIKSKNVIMFNAHRLEFKCEHPILAQMDGETILLQPDDFPAVMTLTSPVIPLLKPGRN